MNAPLILRVLTSAEIEDPEVSTGLSHANNLTPTPILGQLGEQSSYFGLFTNQMSQKNTPIMKE